MDSTNVSKHLTKTHGLEKKDMLKLSKQASSVASSGPRTLSTKDFERLLTGDAKEAEIILRTKVGVIVYDFDVPVSEGEEGVDDLGTPSETKKMSVKKEKQINIAIILTHSLLCR